MSLDRPVRKDEIVIESRGLYIESWLPERRSRRRPLYLLHGELGGSWLWERYLGYFAQRGWEAHALNLRAHFWSERAEVGSLDFDSYIADVIEGIRHLGGNPVLVGHGMGALLALKAAEQHRPSGIVLLGPPLPRELQVLPRPYVLREVPDVFDGDLLGWQSLPEQLRRQNPDLTIDDVLRIQHMQGRESGAARRTMLAGVPVDRQALAGIPTLVIGAGLDRWFPEADAERVAEWLDAEYEPFGAHSHYGLVVGTESHRQVADAIRAFLEAHRL